MPYFGPEESEVTAGDYSQFFQYGMYGLMGSVTGLAREYGGADVGAILKPTQGGLRESQEAQLGDMTPAGRELFQSDIFSSEFYDSPVGWATAQAMGMAPYMAASILPVIATGGYGGLALGAISSGVLTDADMTSSVQDLVDTASHEDLMKSKQYADDIAGGFSEQEARQNLLDTMLGPGAHATAIGLGAIAGGLGVERIAGGAAGRVLGREATKLIPKPSGGVIKSGIKEGVVGATTEFGEEAGTETLIERGEIAGGLREDYDPGRIARAGATGAIIGGPIGVVGGAIEGFGRGGAKPVKPSTDIAPEILAATEAKTQQATPMTGAVNTPPAQPAGAIPTTTGPPLAVAGGTTAPAGAPARAGAPTPASPGSLTGAIPTLPSQVTKLPDPLAPPPDVQAALAAKTTTPAAQAQAQTTPATPPARVPPQQPTPSPAAVPPARVPPMAPVPPGEQVQAGMPPLRTNVPPAGNIPPAQVPPAGPVPAPLNRTPEAVQAGLPPLRPNVPSAAPVPAANVPPMAPVPAGAPVPAARVPPPQPIPPPGAPVVPQGAPLAQQPLPIQPVPPVGPIALPSAPAAPVVAAPVAPALVKPLAAAKARAPKVLEVAPTAETKAITEERAKREEEEREEVKKAPLGPEELAVLHEEQIETGKIGPREKAKKASDKAGAKKLFDKHTPDPKTTETDAEVKARVNAIVDEANKSGTRIPDRIKVNSDEQVWLKDASDLKKAFDKEGGASKNHIQEFQYRERALKLGDNKPLREGRKTEGTEKSAKAQEYKEEAGEGKPATAVAPEEITAEETLDELVEEHRQGEPEKVAEKKKPKQLTRTQLREKLAPKTAEAVVTSKSKEPEYQAVKSSKPVLVVSKEKSIPLPLKTRFKLALKRLDRNPTAAEIAAGNARTAQFSWHGLDVVVQKLKGMLRFNNELPAHYGHIRGTKGADGRPVDVYIGPNIDSPNAFVVDQLDKVVGEFDEHKVMIGFDTLTDATTTYTEAITGPMSPVTIGDVTPMTVDELKVWLADKQATIEPVGAPELEAAGAVNEIEGVDTAKAEIGARNLAWKDRLEIWGVKPTPLSDLRNATELFLETNLFDNPNLARLRDIFPAVMDRILDHVSDVPVYFVSPNEMRLLGHQTGAAYNQFEHIIVLSNEYAQDGLLAPQLPRILAHEALHAAFLRAIYQNDSIREAVQRIANEFRAALVSRGDYANQYAFRSVDEFVSETFSNMSMMKSLATTRASDKLKQALVDANAKPFGRPIRTLWDALRRTVSAALGLKGTQTEHTLLDAMMHVATELELTLESNKPGALTAIENLDRYQQQVFDRNAPSSPWRNYGTTMKFSSGVLPEAAGFQLSDFKKVGEYLPENYRPREGTSQTRVLALKGRTFDGIVQLSKSFGETFHKHARDLYNAIQSMRVRQLELFAKSEPFVAKLNELKKKYKGPVWNHFTNYLHDETAYGVYGDRSIDDQPHLGKDGGKNVTASAYARGKHPQLAAEWNKIPKELQDVRNEMLEHYKGEYEGAALEIIENIVIRITGKENNALAKRIYDKEELTADELKELGGNKELINHLRHTRELGRIKGPYYPLMRLGQFVVSGTYKYSPPTDAKVVKDHPNTFEWDGPDARQRAIDYGTKQRNHARIFKVWVDPTTGETFFEDVNEEGEPIQVKAGPTIMEAEARYRVFVQDQYTEFFDTLKDAQVMDLELRKDPNYIPSHLGARQYNPYETNKRGIMSNEINQLLDTMDKRPEFQTMTPTARLDLEKALRELSLRMHGSTRIQARSLARRNVMGASRDIVAVALQHSEAMSGYRAKLQVQRHIDSARDNLKTSINDTEAGGQKSWAAKQDIYNELAERTTKAESQAPPTWLDEQATRITIMSFVHYLASPAYSINNFLQVAMLAYPQLAAKYGSGTAIRLLLKAYKDMGVMKVLKAGARETKRAAKGGMHVRHNFLTEVLAGIHDSGEKAMLEHLRQTGSITPESGLEIDRRINGGNLDRALDYFQGMARAMPSAVETINRVTVGLAAYRAEMSKSNDHEKAKLTAQEMVNLTQGNYSASNMPAFFNHPLGKLSLQFKKYGFVVYGQLGHNIGLILRNSNPGDRAEGAKALTMLAATHVVMAGALGLPTEPIRWLVTGANIAGLTESNWEDVENYVRQISAAMLGETGGELLSRGLPRMFGIDVSERLGMQSLLTQDTPRSNDEHSLMAFLGEITAGAPGAMGLDVLGGFNDILHGDFIKGASKAVPIKAFRDGINSFVTATEGKKTAAGYEVLPPAGVGDTILRTLGYRPAQQAEIEERRSYIYNAKARLEKQRGDLEREWFAATPNEKTKIWGRIEAYNRSVPRDARLTRTMLQDYSKRKKSEEVIEGFPVTKTSRGLILGTRGVYSTD